MAVSEFPLETRVKRLAERWQVTGNDWDTLVGFYKLPEDVRGLKILDVCAGESDLTAALRERGADATAVDFLYNDPDWLHVRRRIFATRYIDSKDEHYSQKVYDTTLEALETNPASRRYRQSLEKERQRYVYGSAHNLSFADNSFDFVLSFNGILGVTQEDMELLEKSVEEAIRVVKHGGQVQLGPLANGSFDIEGGKNQEILIAKLMERTDLQVNRESFSLKDENVQRITIVKI